MSAAVNTGRQNQRRSSLRYDLRRRVLVSNLSRSVTPVLPATTQHLISSNVVTPPKAILPSKPLAAQLDLLKDIPTDKKVKQQCTSSHHMKQTPEKKAFRMDPSVLQGRNPMIHTPMKAPPKRRYSEPVRDTMSLHLLRENYTPPVKKDRVDDVVLVNRTAQVTPTANELHYDSPPAKPVPLPRKSKISTSSRPSSAGSNSSTDTDPLYARIENCVTGSREAFTRYDQVRIRNTDSKVAQRSTTTAELEAHSKFIRDCTESKRRNSLPIDSAIRLRPRFNSASGECKAKKSLLFSDGIASTKTQNGLTLKNIYAERPESDETPLKETINRMRSSPPEERTTPRICNKSGIYSNNTFVVESKKLKKDEVDKSYGFTCRMRPMLRALSERKTSILLPSKSTKRTAADRGNVTESPVPPTPPPRPPRDIQSITPSKEIAIQTSFVVHDAVSCPQRQPKKRRSSMEIFAEVGAKVKRQSSLMRKKLRRSLETTPVK